jgi:hypothetical protein
MKTVEAADGRKPTMDDYIWWNDIPKFNRTQIDRLYRLGDTWSEGMPSYGWRDLSYVHLENFEIPLYIKSEDRFLEQGHVVFYHPCDNWLEYFEGTDNPWSSNITGIGDGFTPSAVVGSGYINLNSGSEAMKLLKAESPYGNPGSGSQVIAFWASGFHLDQTYIIPRLWRRLSGDDYENGFEMQFIGNGLNTSGIKLAIWRGLDELPGTALKYFSTTIPVGSGTDYPLSSEYNFFIYRLEYESPFTTSGVQAWLSINKSDWIDGGYMSEVAPPGWTGGDGGPRSLTWQQIMVGLYESAPDQPQRNIAIDEVIAWNDIPKFNRTQIDRLERLGNINGKGMNLYGWYDLDYEHVDPWNDEIPLFLKVPFANNITLYENSHIPYNSGILLYEYGYLINNNEIPLTIYTHVAYNDNVPLYILGPTFPPAYSGCIFFHSCDDGANEWVQDLPWIHSPSPIEHAPFIVEEGWLDTGDHKVGWQTPTHWYDDISAYGNGSLSGNLTALFWMSGVVNEGHEVHLGWMSVNPTTVGIYCNGKNDILQQTSYTPVLYASGLTFSGAIQNDLIFNETMFCVRAEYAPGATTLKLSIDGGAFVNAGTFATPLFAQSGNIVIGALEHKTHTSGIMLDEIAFWADIDEFTAVELEQFYTMGQNKQSLIKYTDTYEAPILPWNDSIPLYMYGIDSANNNISLHMSGVFRYNDEIPLYLENWSADAQIPLFLNSPSERYRLWDLIYLNDHDPQFIGDLSTGTGNTTIITVWKIENGIPTEMLLSNSGCYAIGDTGRWGWSTEYLPLPKGDQYFYSMNRNGTTFQGEAFVKSVRGNQKHPRNINEFFAL